MSSSTSTTTLSAPVSIASISDAVTRLCKVSRYQDISLDHRGMNIMNPALLLINSLDNIIAEIVVTFKGPSVWWRAEWNKPIIGTRIPGTTIDGDYFIRKTQDLTVLIATRTHMTTAKALAWCQAWHWSATSSMGDRASGALRLLFNYSWPQSHRWSQPLKDKGNGSWDKE